MNHRCLPHVETSLLIFLINQLTGFYVIRSLFVDGLRRIFLPNKSNIGISKKIFKKETRTLLLSGSFRKSSPKILKYGCQKTSDNIDTSAFLGFNKAFIVTPYATKNTIKIVMKYSTSSN